MNAEPYRASRAPTANGDLIAQLETAERYRDDALEERSRLAQAVAASKAATSAHEAALRTLDEANARLRELQSGRGAEVAAAVGVTVYEFWIDTPRYSGSVRGATAEVTQTGDVHHVSDVTGTTKSGLGGAVVGGLLFGPVGAAAGLVATRKNNVKTQVRTVDTRQFEFRIVGPGFAWSTVQGPESGSNLRDLRDAINARGSSLDDLQTVASQHVGIVRRETLAATQAGAAAQSANATLSQEQHAYEMAWAHYSKVRLPILLDLRARWARAGVFKRGAAVAFGPVVLAAWIIALAVALRLRREDLALGAYATAAGQLAAVAAIAVHYVKTIRLRKAG
jgi:hypothetical protein